MIFFALFIGVCAIGITYVRQRHSLMPLICLIAGFVFIIAGHLFIKTWHEAIVVPIGGLLIAAAHFFNYKYSRISVH